MLHNVIRHLRFFIFMPTLLEQAKKVTKSRKSYTEEELDLIRAWLNDEVSYTAVQRILNKDQHATYRWLAFGARFIFKKLSK